MVFINVPSSMNPLVQSCTNSPKKYDRDIWVELLVIPLFKIGSETLPLCSLDLSHYSNPKGPHTTKKQKNIKPSPGRYEKDMTKLLQVNKNITRKYRQQIIKFWFVPVSFILPALFKETQATSYKNLVCAGTGTQDSSL